MKQIAVTRSIVSAKALADVIAQEYPLDGPVTCTLFSKMLRTQDNDHYLVTSNSGRSVARVYQRGTHLKRKKSDYLYELDWLSFLRENELPVSYPISRNNGSYLGRLKAPEGKRYYTLISFAEGQTTSEENEEQLYILGREMARIHLVSNDYDGKFERQPMDLDYLVDKPVERLKQLWKENRDDRLEILMISAEEAREAILDLLGNEEDSEDSWGPIGGDFHPSNTRFDEANDPTFFNFDLCGYGWRAFDIASFLLNANLMLKSSELSEAFFAGYYSVRPLSRNEHASIAHFLTLRRIWLTGTFAGVEGVVGYTFIAPAMMEIR